MSLNRTENCILFIYPILTMSQIFLAATTTLSRVCTQRRHLLTAQNWIRRKQKTAQFNTQPPFEDPATQNGSSRISSSKWHFVMAVARVWVIYCLYQWLEPRNLHEAEKQDLKWRFPGKAIDNYKLCSVPALSDKEGLLDLLALCKE